MEQLSWRQRTGVALNVSFFPFWWRLAVERYDEHVVTSLGPITITVSLYRPN
jgi:hypothetical protein